MRGQGIWTRRAFLAAGGAGAVTAVWPAWGRPAAASRPRAAAGGWPPAIGVCRSIDDASPARAAGAAYIEVSCSQWLVPGEPRARFEPNLERLRAAAVPVRAANGFLPGSLKCVGPQADPGRTLAYAATAFRRAEEAGIRTITFGSGAARRIPEGYPPADAELQFVALLAGMAPIAERHGIMVCVEPLQRRETNMINRVSEARRLVAAVRHPQIGITADVFHMLREDEPPQSIREAASLIRHAHIAEKRGRTPPGHDGDDFRPYLKALEDVGYEGLLSIECRWRDLASELPLAIETLRMQLGEVSATSP